MDWHLRLESVDRPRLRRASEHMAYELWMLRETEGGLRFANDPEPDVRRNALLESFALHARNLHDVFFRPRSGTDIHAAHFVREGAWLAPEVPILSDGRSSAHVAERAAQELARLALLGRRSRWTSALVE